MAVIAKIRHHRAMTSSDIALIQNSYRQLIHVSDQAGAIFLARLFELDPSLRTQFQGDLQTQSPQMVHALRYFVACLDQLPQTLNDLRQAGLDHSNQLIPDSNYQHFCDALVWTLSKCLGRHFTDELRTTWAKAYWLLAESMRAGNRDGFARNNRAVA
jgi:hemoglobin-like flavoprotein